MFRRFRASMTNVAVRLHSGITACIREAKQSKQRQGYRVSSHGHRRKFY